MNEMAGYPGRELRRRVVAGLFCAALCAGSPGATLAGEGETLCAPAVQTWLDACAGAEQQKLQAIHCVDDHVVIEVAGDPPLRLDIARDGRKSFRRAGNAGISPIGQFDDWNRAPESSRRGLDAVAACVTRDAAFLDAPTMVAPTQQPTTMDVRPRRVWPWIVGPVAAGVALAVGVGIVVRRRKRARDAGTADTAQRAGQRTSGEAGERGERQPASEPGDRDDVTGNRNASGDNASGRGAGEPDGQRPRDRRWFASAAWVLALLASVTLVELWAIQARDPDFFMPDPFHYLAVAVMALFSGAAFVPWPRVRHGLMLLAITTPLAILAIEVRLSTAAIENERIALSDDAVLRYTYRPGHKAEISAGETIAITENGLWDVPHRVPKPAGVTRVVVLGDSVPNDPSVPFRKRFPKQLEAMLAERATPGRKVEVLNVSCEGYNTLQEVRLLETVGVQYEPDVVVLAYVLNDPFLQNGGYRRLGNSFFAFNLANVVPRESACPIFADLHAGYTFELVVRNSLGRLKLLAQLHHFQVLVAPLPVVQPFADASCMATYDKVVGISRELGFAADRVVDAFAGEDHRRFLKPSDPHDITHPNAEGHERIARRLAELVTPLLAERKAPPAPRE